MAAMSVSCGLNGDLLLWLLLVVLVLLLLLLLLLLLRLLPASQSRHGTG